MHLYLFYTVNPGTLLKIRKRSDKKSPEFLHPKITTVNISMFLLFIGI